MSAKTKYSLLTLTSAFLLMVFALLPQAMVQAQNRINPREAFQQTIQRAGLAENEITTVETAAGRVVFTALTYIGVITLILIIYAGGMWATARGNEEQIKRAKKILIGSVIGLIIIFMAGAIANVLIRTIGGVS